MEKINISQKLSLFSDYWNPRLLEPQNYWGTKRTTC